MKKSFLIHAVWLIVAVVAFMVGSKQFTAEAESGASDEDARSASRYSNRSQAARDGSTRKLRAATRAERAEAGAGDRLSGNTPLTTKSIDELGEILKMSRDPIERRLAFTQLIQGLTADNAKLLREQIVHMSTDSSEWKEFHYAWGALAGEVAVKFGAESQQRDRAACFSGWASADPGAALAWFESQPESHQMRGDLKWGAVYGLSNTDPRLATEFVTERMKAGDKEAGKMINLVAESILRAGDHISAAQWSESLPEGDVRDVAVGRVARDYANEDPAQAVAWLESLPEGKAQHRGISSAFSTWAVADNQAAANRLNQMKQSPVRDSAVKAYTKRIAGSDPKAALDWVSTISDAKLRDKSLVGYGRFYLSRDREGANQWLQNSGLSPELKERITKSRKRK